MIPLDDDEDAILLLSKQQCDDMLDELNVEEDVFAQPEVRFTVEFSF